MDLLPRDRAATATHLSMLAPKDLSAALRVFHLSELSNPICELVDQSDRIALLRVCHQLHRCTAPFVWEYIRDLNVLMKLIPGARIYRNVGVIGLNVCVQFTMFV